MRKDKFEKTKYPNIWKNIEDGTYAIDISLGYDKRGKRIRTTRTKIPTEKEAKKILKDEKELNKIKMYITEKELFQDLLEEYYNWLLYSKKVSVLTVRTKRSRMNSRILPFFNNMKIVLINENDIQKFHKFLDQEKKENEQPLDSETKHNIHKTLSSYFNWLKDHKKIIQINPCTTVSNFRIEKKEIKYYTLENIDAVIKEIDCDELLDTFKKKFAKAVIKGLFFTGFRVGEFMGLRFSDIDFDILNKESIDVDEIKIEITEPVTYGKNGWNPTKGKTKKSLGVCYIGKSAFFYIFDYVKYMQKCGFEFDKNDYIFLNPISNKITSPTQIRKLIYHYMDLAGLPRLKLKDFRHSYASLLLNNGYRLEDVKEALRHESIRTTEKHYATLYSESKKNLAKDIDRFA